MKYKNLIYVLMILSLAFLLSGCTEINPNDKNIIVDDTTTTVDSDSQPSDSLPDVVIKLQGNKFNFLDSKGIAPDLVVKEGQKVRVEFESIDGFHDFVIDEFNARTNQVNPEDGVVFVEFVASEKGTYEYYCSVGNHRALGMKGAFIVE